MFSMAYPRLLLMTSMFMASTSVIANDTEANRPPVFDMSSVNADVVASQSPGNIEKTSDGYFSVGGFVQENLAYSYEADHFSFSKARTSLDLRVDMNFSEVVKGKAEVLTSYDFAYHLEGRDEFTKDTLDVYESDTRLQEAYLDFDFASWFNLRSGRQYFTWGESEGSQIGDIGNPRDYREMGLQEIEDARLPVGANKITFYGSDWEYNIISIHEFRPNEFGAKGSAYDPYISIRRAGGNIIETNEPDSYLKNPEIISRLFLSRSFGDVSFFAGEIYDDFPVFAITNNSDANSIDFVPEYFKYKRFGLFGNFVSGSMLFKYDIAKSLDKPFNRSGLNIFQQVESNQGKIFGSIKSDLLQCMVGFEYTGISETLVSVELYRESVENYVEKIFQDDEHSTEASVYITRDFWNDRLLTTFWVNRLITESATMFRVDATFQVNDQLEVSLAFTGINSSDSESYFFDYRKTDRAVLSMKYSF